MMHQAPQKGLYLARKWAGPMTPVFHWGIIDIGQCLGGMSLPAAARHTLVLLEGAEEAPGTVVHRTPGELRYEPVSDLHRWKLLRRIEDEAGARARIAHALQDPAYNLVGNNCEHFARYIADGRKHSGQVMVGLMGLMGLGAAAFYATTRWLIKRR